MKKLDSIEDGIKLNFLVHNEDRARNAVLIILLLIIFDAIYIYNIKTIVII